MRCIKGGAVVSKLLNIREVVEIVGLSKNTIYRKIAKGVFPPGLVIDTYIRRWREDEILEWIESRPRGKVVV